MVKTVIMERQQVLGAPIGTYAQRQYVGGYVGPKPAYQIEQDKTTPASIPEVPEADVTKPEPTAIQLRDRYTVIPDNLRAGLVLANLGKAEGQRQYLEKKWAGGVPDSKHDLGVLV